jgi:hypothetical protein
MTIDDKNRPVSERQETCPGCQSPYDNRVHSLQTCGDCGGEFSTACCLTAGNGSSCVQCEEAA